MLEVCLPRKKGAEAILVASFQGALAWPRTLACGLSVQGLNFLSFRL